jgi:hypothetical protein
MLAAIVAIVLAQEIVPTAPSQAHPPARSSGASASAVPPTFSPPGDLSSAPPLPDGPMMPVAKDDKGETFLVVDRVGKSGDVADFWTFEAFVPPIQIRPGASVVQGLAHHQVNCSNSTDQTLASAGYDESGVAIVALAASPVASLVADSPYGMIARVLCKGKALPKAGETHGHAAALTAARQPSGG